MENGQSGACKASLEEIKKGALAHYEELATKCHHWSSFIPQAIQAYQEPPEHSVITIPASEYNSLLEWLDTAIILYEVHEKTDLSDNMRSYIRGRLKQLEEVKEKLISLNTK